MKSFMKYFMKYFMSALMVLTLLGGAAPGHASPATCTEKYFRSHRNGTCGWHTTQNIIHHYFKGATWAVADCIVRHESGYRARAVSPDRKYWGLFQFGRDWWEGKWNPLNPILNALRALKYHQDTGNWNPWAGDSFCW